MQDDTLEHRDDDGHRGDMEEDDDDNVPAVSRAEIKISETPAVTAVSSPRAGDTYGDDPVLARRHQSLQAVLHGERAVHVQIKVNNQIITEDDMVVTRGKYYVVVEMPC